MTPWAARAGGGAHDTTRVLGEAPSHDTPEGAAPGSGQEKAKVRL